MELVTSRRETSLAAHRIPDSAEAFADWVSPHIAVMARLAARAASDSERDDVVQEALLRAWKKRSQYDSTRGSVRTWLLAITADQARRARSRARPTSVVADLTVPSRSLLGQPAPQAIRQGCRTAWRLDHEAHVPGHLVAGRIARVGACLGGQDGAALGAQVALYEQRHRALADPDDGQRIGPQVT